jgi:methyltransferase (TIGR00027 family)
MAGSDDDTWGPATRVGTTPTLVATARALATRAGLVNDPFAAPLVGAVGLDFFTRVASGQLAPGDLDDDNGMSMLTDLFAARTQFFDDFLTDACRAGLRQVVILASGLDARPYRLWWPPGTTVYEIDQPQVIDCKSLALRSLGAGPTVNRCAVGVDLRRDWPAALRRVGFDASEPTAWIAEGLLIGFLTPATQDRLLDHVTALSAPGSRVAADYLPERQKSAVSHVYALVQRWKKFGYVGDTTEFTYSEEHRDAAESLVALGWRAVVTEPDALVTTAGLPGLGRQDSKGALLAGRYVRAVLA